MLLPYNTRNRKVCPIKHLYIPSLLRINDVSTAITSTRNSNKMKLNVSLLYTYIIKGIVYEKDKDKGSWAQIPKSNLRTMLGTDYVQYIQQLQKANLLEVKVYSEEGEYYEKGHYWSNEYGGECKRYRIPAHLFTEDRLYKIVRVEAGDLLLNKLASLKKGGINYVEEYRNKVISNMDDIILLDTSECRAVLDDLYANKKIHVQSEDYLEFFNNCPISVPVVCDFGHRAHHKVVTKNKRLNPYQRFKDDLDSRLTEIDIVCSQAAILANINAKLIRTFAPECSSAIRIFEKYANDKKYKEFQELCFTGLLYEHLRDEFNKFYGHALVTPITRDDAKKIFFTAAFSNYDHYEQATHIANSQHKVNELLRYGAGDDELDAALKTLFNKRAYYLFKNLFPAVWNLFDEIKQLKWGFNPGKQHSNNCLLAQRIESGIVYTRFVRALFDNSITRMTTTHDSINVKEKDEERARKIIQKEISKLKLNIKLKIKSTH
jgi:hypothetical protein